VQPIKPWRYLSEDLVRTIRCLRVGVAGNPSTQCTLDQIIRYVFENHHNYLGEPLVLSRSVVGRICGGSLYASFSGPRTTKAQSRKIQTRSASVRALKIAA
jgi:hypothetical protein